MGLPEDGCPHGLPIVRAVGQFSWESNKQVQISEHFSYSERRSYEGKQRRFPILRSAASRSLSFCSRCCWCTGTIATCGPATSCSTAITSQSCCLSVRFISLGVPLDCFTFCRFCAQKRLGNFVIWCKLRMFPAEFTECSYNSFGKGSALEPNLKDCCGFLGDPVLVSGPRCQFLCPVLRQHVLELFHAGRLERHVHGGHGVAGLWGSAVAAGEALQKTLSTSAPNWAFK